MSKNVVLLQYQRQLLNTVGVASAGNKPCAFLYLPVFLCLDIKGHFCLYDLSEESSFINNCLLILYRPLKIIRSNELVFLSLNESVVLFCNYVNWNSHLKERHLTLIAWLLGIEQLKINVFVLLTPFGNYVWNKAVRASQMFALHALFD